MKITIPITLLLVVLILPSPIFAQKNYLIINGKKYELAPGPSYYDAHPEEKTRLVEDNKAKEQKYKKTNHKDYPSTPPPPPPPTTPPPSVRIGVRGGAIDTTTGEFFPQVKGGVIKPQTGEFLPDVGKGYIDPKTGEFIPKK